MCVRVHLVVSARRHPPCLASFHHFVHLSVVIQMSRQTHREREREKLIDNQGTYSNHVKRVCMKSASFTRPRLGGREVAK